MPVRWTISEDSTDDRKIVRNRYSAFLRTYSPTTSSEPRYRRSQIRRFLHGSIPRQSTPIQPANGRIDTQQQQLMQQQQQQPGMPPNTQGISIQPDGITSQASPGRPGFSMPGGPQRVPEQAQLSDMDKQRGFAMGGPQRMDFSRIAFNFIHATPYVGPGWQASISIAERVGKAQDL